MLFPKEEDVDSCEDECLVAFSLKVDRCCHSLCLAADNSEEDVVVFVERGCLVALMGEGLKIEGCGFGFLFILNSVLAYEQ